MKGKPVCTATMALVVQSAGDDVDGPGCVAEEAAMRAEGQFIAAVERGEMAHVGGGRSPVELGIERERNERGRVAADAGVPCRSVVEILGVGVVAAELESAGERAAHIDDERVDMRPMPCDTHEVELARLGLAFFAPAG